MKPSELREEIKSKRRPRVPLKLVVGIGTRFNEQDKDGHYNPCIVTRVTDLDFDTLDTVTGLIQVRNLRIWESERFRNRINGLTDLLKLSESISG